MGRTYHILLAFVLIFALTSCGLVRRAGSTDDGRGNMRARQATLLTPTSLPVAAEPSPAPNSKPGASRSPKPSPIPDSEPEPAQVSEPSPTPVPAAKGTITIEEPVAGASITSPVTVKGTTDFWPFEANLTGQVKDATGNILGKGPIMVQAPDIGQGGPFEGEIPFTSPATEQDGTLEVVEFSAKDGSVVVKESVPVRLATPADQPDTSELRLDAPVEGQAVTLPLHVALRGAKPDERLRARLRFSTGTVLEQPIEVVVGNDDVGYAVHNLQWNTESAPPPFGPGPATFELAREDGSVIKRVPVNVLPDSETQTAKVAWVGSPDGQELIIFDQKVPKTPRIATAALQALLNGPPYGNLAGAITALPTVRDIVTFPGRQPDWGYEVKLIDLTINDGVAVANFSKEMRAYGGGSTRVQAIRQQIERTLKQFSTVNEVEIQIEGQSEGVLEP